MVGPHLNDGNLGIGGYAQKGEGHTEVVVVVAGGGMGAVAAAEDGMNQFLGGGFAIGAGDADDRNGEMLAVVFGQFLQCCQHVRHQDAAVVDTVLGGADDAEGCT